MLETKHAKRPGEPHREERERERERGGGLPEPYLRYKEPGKGVTERGFVDK